MTIPRAIEVFCNSFAFLRSINYPFEVARIGPLRVLRDAPRRAKGGRAEEIVVCGTGTGTGDDDYDPTTIAKAIKAYRPPRYSLCVVTHEEHAAEAKAAYKSLGYRARSTERLMICPTGAVRRIPAPAPVKLRRVLTPADTDAIFKVARTRQIRAQDLTDARPKLRLYGAFASDGHAVGWVRSVAIARQATYVSNMYVKPQWRRQGIGKALMSRMLTDDRKAGAKTSVLVASSAGAMLYPTVGYRTIGLLLLFSPPKR